MQRARARPIDVTPEYEDAGLFKTGICQVVVELVPVIRRNSRQDLVVTGYVGSDKEVSVVFAGRRTPAAKTLVMHLEQQRSILRRHAARSNKPTPDMRAMRLPVRVEGTWRKTLQADPDGWQVNRYELVAAQWVIITSQGNPMQFGNPPAV